jgi:hypothetical protein
VLIRHSRGAEHMERTFFRRNMRWERVMSAKVPAVKVIVASVRPIMVRYWKCQP